MKHIFLFATASLFSATSLQAVIIASQDFDSPMNVSAETATPALNSFTNGADAWGIYSRPTGGPADLYDETVDDPNNPGTPDPGDGTGIIRSTKTDSFFGIADTTNGDNSTGEVTYTVTFDISSGFTLTEMTIDFAAMGDFESGDIFSVRYSIDGAALITAFTGAANETIDNYTYTLEDGTTRQENDPYTMNNVILDNNLTTLSAPLSGTGNSLAVTFDAITNGGDEVIVFDNIVINGIPEPSAALLSILGGLGFLARRRR